MAELGSWVTQNVITTNPEVTVYEAAVLMKKSHVGSVLVTENGLRGGKLLGIFTERDLLNKVVSEDRSPKNTKLAEVMTPNPKAMTVQDDARDVYQVMEEGGFRHVPIVDTHGGAIGIVSIKDLMKLVEARSMAETALDLTW